MDEGARKGGKRMAVSREVKKKERKNGSGRRDGNYVHVSVRENWYRLLERFKRENERTKEVECGALRN